MTTIEEAKLMAAARTVAQKILDESKSRGYTEAHIVLLATAFVRGYAAGMAQGQKIFNDVVNDVLLATGPKGTIQ